jgi:hypothetical protein
MATSYTRPSDDIAKYPAKSENPLNQYSSVNCLFTLAALSREQLASRSFSSSSLKNIIATSKGNWGDGGKNRVVTEFGSFDYFIDDVIIASTPSHSSQTGNTSANKLSFKITEPYSMALFYLTLQAGAEASGYKNYKLAPFLLMIEFVGYRDDNKPYIDPVLTRFIPISLLKSKMKVTGAGTVYELDATPYNEKAHADHFSTIKKDHNLQGANVKDLLTGGGSSLLTVIKKQFEEDIKDNLVDKQDKVEIHFPKDFTDPNDSGNEISRSILFSDFNDNGTIRFPNQDAIYDQRNQIYQNKKITLDKDKNFHFEQNMKIQDIITEVILRSDYITKQLLTAEPITNDKGMVKWFRIELNVFDEAHSETFNRQTHKFVYRILPFEVHISKLLPPKGVPKGYDKIQKTVIRVYDYIYTGNNTQIQSLELDFNTSFFTSIPADAGSRPGTDNQNQTGDAKGKPAQTSSTSSGGNTDSRQQGAANTSSAPATNSPASGSGSNNTQTAQVQALQALLTNPSDMVKVTMTILGDPYFVPSSGMGNQIVKPSSGKTADNQLSDGSINYQNGEIDVVINFRTPVDLDPVTGSYRFIKTADEFSGLYFITKVESKFSQNKFTNVLYVTRRRAQLEGFVPSAGGLFKY